MLSMVISHCGMVLSVVNSMQSEGVIPQRVLRQSGGRGAEGRLKHCQFPLQCRQAASEDVG